MKKLAILSGILLSLIISQTVSAKALSEFLPTDSSMYFEYSLSAKNPLKETQINTVSEWFAEQVFENTESQQEKAKTDIVKATKELLTNKTIYFGGSITTEEVYVGINSTDAQYDNFVKSLGKLVTKENDSPKIYSIDGEPAFTKIDDLIIFTETEEKLVEFLNSKNVVLSDNKDYKKINDKLDKENFLKFYFNLDLLKETIGLNLEPGMLATLQQFGIAAKQTDSGFSSTIINTFDPEKLKALGVDLKANNFTPLLYKYLPSNKPILYTEFSNLKTSIDNAINLSLKESPFGPTISEFRTTYDDYFSLTEKEGSILIQQDKQILPAITIIFNTSGHKEIAEKTAKDLIVLIEETMKGERLIYTKSSNKGLTTFNLDIKNLEESEETIDDFEKIPAEMSKFSFTVGTTPENYLLFSTYSKIDTEYGQGLDKNPDFTKAFPNLSATSAGYSYLNAQNLAGWYDGILEIAMLTSETDFVKDEINETRELLKNLVKPWHDLAISKQVFDDYAGSEITANFDLEALTLNYFAQFEEFTNAVENSFEYTTEEATAEDFRDTSEEDWYYDDVRELDLRGIAGGYEDNSFRPNAPITRAEFLAMLLRGISDYNPHQNYKTDTNSRETIGEFRDVYRNDWYADYVQEGVYLGIVKGFGDKTFRPNDPITRAEAIQMLNNMINNRYQNEVRLPVRAFSDPFKDVRPNDWYYDSVQNVYGYSIIDGENNGAYFNPNRNLNRAESSKIINQTIRSIDSIPEEEVAPELGDWLQIR